MFIDSLTNAQVKAWVALHQAKGRRETGTFLVEGNHLVEEAHKAKALELILVKEGRTNPYPEIQAIILSAKVFNKVSQIQSEGSLMAVCRLDPHPKISGERILLCDRIQDPGNLGTLIRTAMAFGFDAILCSDDCVDVTNDKVIRSTQGALFHISVQQTDLKQAISELRSRGVHVYGTSLKHAVPLSSVKALTPVALVLGNEGSGVSPEVLALCEQNLVIESNAFESLNVAVAGGILMHHFRK